jgi:hypothetical protein
MFGQDMHRDEGCADSLTHPVASIALEEGCSRIEAALWALIAEGSGEDPAKPEAPVRQRIGRYVRDRRRGDASAATLLGLLRQVQPRPASGWQAWTAG